MKKIIYAIICCLCLIGCQKKIVCDKDNLKIIVASDLHYFLKDYYQDCDWFEESMLYGDGKMVTYGDEIVDAFISAVLHEKPELVILTGDLSFNGEKESHQQLAQKLEQLREKNIQVAVIPGNHDIDNIYTKASVYEYLYRLSEKPKYNQYLKTYCDSLLFYNDSIIAIDKGKQIIAYKEKYNNEKLITEKQKLELEKANITYWWMFTVVIVLLLGILLIYIYLRKRITIQKKEEELTSLALQLHQKELEVEKNESYIVELQSQFAENNKKKELYIEQIEALKNLKKENERLSLEKNMLHEKIASYSISSHELSNVKTLSDRLLLLEKREKELCSLLLTQIPFLRNLHLKPVYLNDTELSDICQVTDNIFHNFTQRLSKEISSLSEHEIILCCLIKLRFSITEIAVFLNIAPTSVSRSKLRIKNKIYSELGEDSKEKSLDIWLWEY